MSEALPTLEIEPEWCSEAMLSSISAVDHPNDTQATEPFVLPSVEPAAEPLATLSSESDATPKSDPVPVKPARSTSKARSESKTPKSKKSPQSTKTMRLVTALRSRRVRIVATVVSVLFVCGLIVLNWKSGSPSAGDEITEMDLSDFNSTSGFDELQIGNGSEPRPLGNIADAESMAATDRFAPTESGPRLSPLGSVIHADHTTSRRQTGGGLVPASATSGGPRGAVLTGQIEYETGTRSTETSLRPSRSFGLR